MAQSKSEKTNRHEDHPSGNRCVDCGDGITRDVIRCVPCHKSAMVRSAGVELMRHLKNPPVPGWPLKMRMPDMPKEKPEMVLAEYRR